MAGNASSGEKNLTSLDVEIHQVEDNAMGNIAKANVVELDAFSGVDHFDVVKIWFIHGLEVWDFDMDPFKIELCGLIRVHTNKLNEGKHF